MPRLDGETQLRGRLAPEAMFPAGVSSISVRYVVLDDGLRLRVAEAGGADAPPVVLVHGWGASIYMWRAWFEPLARAGWRVVAVDLPGHGLSDKPDDDKAYTLEAMSSALRRLLECEGLLHAPVIAQSMGATLALQIATERESAGALVLVNPACFGELPIIPPARAVSGRSLDRVLPHLVSRWVVGRTHRLVYGESARITERDVDEYWAPSQFPAYASAMRRLVRRFDWRRPPVEGMAARLRALATPPLVVLGTRDRLVRRAAPYGRALLDAGVSMVLHVIHGGGHAVNEERPEEVIGIVLAHLGPAIRHHGDR